MKIFLTMMLVFVTVIIASVSAGAATFDSEMQYQTENKVTIWSKKDYKGKSVEYGIGAYSSIDNP